MRAFRQQLLSRLRLLIACLVLSLVAVPTAWKRPDARPIAVLVGTGVLVGAGVPADPAARGTQLTRRGALPTHARPSKRLAPQLALSASEPKQRRPQQPAVDGRRLYLSKQVLLC